MTEQAKELIALATKLPPGERITLVEEILSSLDQPDAEMDRLWAKEAEDRLAAYRRGEIKVVDLDEVLAKYRTA
jgi:putative addiction module component (TIGR02574 family)